MADQPEKKLTPKERIDVLLARANEEATMRRHHEGLRDRAGATFLTLSTALLALYGAVLGKSGSGGGTVAVSVWAVGAAVPLSVAVLGIFGVLVVARHSGHVLRHMAFEGALRREAFSAIQAAGGADLGCVYRHAEGEYESESERRPLMALLSSPPTRWLWMVPNALVAAFGVLLVLVAVGAPAILAIACLGLAAAALWPRVAPSA